MSLPTPPKTSHREKENRLPGSARSVVWSQQNQYHSLSSPPQFPATCSASRKPPARSILKKTSQPILPFIDVEQREVTPEPNNPLHDSSYLKTPVSQIISPDSKLSDLIAGYSVLTARLRPSVTEETDSSCPLLEPLKENRDAIYRSIDRDVRRALVDPMVNENQPKDCPVLLPSPTHSPRKKKCMTAEQAKYGRDLCTITQSVLRLLNLIFTLPAVYEIFTVTQLKNILTQVLAIPLADSLPTPNARKTCAISILVIQCQRLPEEVLAPASSRIAFSLLRGIDGELGKEGKRGSANDGLKAVHELSVYQPSTFIPVFVKLLPSILNNLLAPTVSLRVQACNALGGLVLGSINLPHSYEIHTRISSHIASFLTTVSPAKPSPSKTSPTKAVPNESPICRTLRTTLNAPDPIHVAQGPVWALSVLANCIVLLGSALYTDIRLSRIIHTLLALPMRHKKSSVRALACVVWRCVTWAYYQPQLPSDPEGESETEDSPQSSPSGSPKQGDSLRAALWKVVQSVVGMGSGVSTVAACVGSETGDDGLRRTFVVLGNMLSKNSEFKDAMLIISQLVSLETLPAGWHSVQLLPDKLFHTDGGLLLNDFESLQKTVRPILNQCPGINDVRPLTKEELTVEVLDEFFSLWKRAVSVGENIENHLDVIEETWTCLLKAGRAICEDTTEENWIAEKATDIIFGMIESCEQEATPESSKSGSQRAVFDTSRPKQQSRWSPGKRLNMMRSLWAYAKNALDNDSLDMYAEKLLASLMKNEEEWTEVEGVARAQWAMFCAELSVSCEPDSLKAFWGYQVIVDAHPWVWTWTKEARSVVWSKFVKVWSSKCASWEGALVLLSVPFGEQHAWDMDGQELTVWDKLLALAIDKALDYGVDALCVVNQLVESIGGRCDTTFSSLTRVVEMMLMKVSLSDAQEVPESFVEFVTDTFRSSYPPEPRNYARMMWMIRSVVHFIESCPVHLVFNLMETMQEGLVLWIADEFRTMTEDDYALDVLPLYQAIMLGLQAVPQTEEIFEALSTLLEAIFCGRMDKPAAVLDTFNDFWEYASCGKLIPSTAWPPKVQEYFNVDNDDRPCLGEPFNDNISAQTEPIRAVSPLTVPSAPFMNIIAGFPSSTGPSLLLESPTILSTPKNRTRTKVSSPPRPNLSPDLARFALIRSPTTPSRRPSTSDSSSGHSPSKRRRVEKENESPVSVKVHSQPNSPSKKRRLSGHDDIEEKSPKKARLTHALVPITQATSGSPNESDLVLQDDVFMPDTKSISAAIKPNTSKSLFTPTPTRTPKKRKTMLMEAVEVPSFKQLLSREKREAVRTVKIYRAVRKQSETPETPGSPGSGSPCIPEMLDFGSDDSMMSINDSSPAGGRQLLSSDDDPHIGQVTPRHLTSPALRRGRSILDDDPPSDDSNEPASPSRDMVLRRLGRHQAINRNARALA